MNFLGLLALAWSGRLSRAARRAILATLKVDLVVFIDHYLSHSVKMRKFYFLGIFDVLYRAGRTLV